jgi:NAD(P)H-dependent FMN reductase
VLKALRELLQGMRMNVVPTQVSVPNSAAAFDPDGHLIPGPATGTLDQLSADLAQALQPKAAA